MKLFKHLSTQPFIVATGIAALLHSTWALAIYFTGLPKAGANPLEVLGYYVPAFLIAFSLDVGQIVTSIEIREGQRNWQKYTTFLIFALATFYLQFLYISSHLPVVAQGDGVRTGWTDGIQLMRDCAVFVLPALLPLSTLLYTFSTGKTPRPDPVNATDTKTVTISAPEPDPAPVSPEPETRKYDPRESEVSVIPDPPLALTFQPVSRNGNGSHH